MTMTKQINKNLWNEQNDLLCIEFHPFLHREDTCFRQAMSIRKRVTVALWRLDSDYRTI